MKTKEKLIADFKIEHPTITKVFNDEVILLSEAEYEITVNQWADNVLNSETEKVATVKAEADKLAAKQSAQAKLAALGLTDNEVAAILGN